MTRSCGFQSVKLLESESLPLPDSPTDESLPRNRFDVGDEFQRRNRPQATHIALLKGRVEKVSHHRPRTVVVERPVVSGARNIGQMTVFQRTLYDRSIGSVRLGIEFTGDNEGRDLAFNRPCVFGRFAERMQPLADAWIGEETAIDQHGRVGLSSYLLVQFRCVQRSLLETLHRELQAPAHRRILVSSIGGLSAPGIHDRIHDGLVARPDSVDEHRNH
jgi:hypothetical protein